MTAMTNIKRPAVRLDARTALLVSTTLALIIIDLTNLTIAAAVGALALASFVAAYLYFQRLQEQRYVIYGFIIAQLSPISVQAELVTAVAYQLLCVLFLTALIAPFPRFSKLSSYARPALLTLPIAAASVALGLALTLWLDITDAQAAAVSGTALLLAVLVALRVTQDDTRVRKVVEA